jgi:hypothetical protein
MGVAKSLNDSSASTVFTKTRVLVGGVSLVTLISIAAVSSSAYQRDLQRSSVETDHRTEDDINTKIQSDPLTNPTASATSVPNGAGGVDSFLETNNGGTTTRQYTTTTNTDNGTTSQQHTYTTNIDGSSAIDINLNSEQSTTASSNSRSTLDLNINTQSETSSSESESD